MSHQILREIGRLQRCAPRPDAPAEVVAAWYERKAVLFEHIAADGDARPSDALRQARLAHQHAVQLLNRTTAHRRYRGSLPEVATR